MKRRQFIRAAGVAGLLIPAAPAIVKAENIMRIAKPPAMPLWFRGTYDNRGRWQFFIKTPPGTDWKEVTGYAYGKSIRIPLPAKPGKIARLSMDEVTRPIREPDYDDQQITGDLDIRFRMEVDDWFPGERE